MTPKALFDGPSAVATVKICLPRAIGTPPTFTNVHQHAKHGVGHSEGRSHRKMSDYAANSIR